MSPALCPLREGLSTPLSPAPASPRPQGWGTGSAVLPPTAWPVPTWAWDLPTEPRAVRVLRAAGVSASPPGWLPCYSQAPPRLARGLRADEPTRGRLSQGLPRMLLRGWGSLEVSRESTVLSRAFCSPHPPSDGEKARWPSLL